MLEICGWLMNAVNQKFGIFLIASLRFSKNGFRNLLYFCSILRISSLAFSFKASIYEKWQNKINRRQLIYSISNRNFTRKIVLVAIEGQLLYITHGTHIHVYARPNNYTHKKTLTCTPKRDAFSKDCPYESPNESAKSSKTPRDAKCQVHVQTFARISKKKVHENVFVVPTHIFIQQRHKP